MAVPYPNRSGSRRCHRSSIRMQASTEGSFHRLAARVRQRRAFGRGLLRELAGACRHASDARSLGRLSADILLFRVLFVFPGLAAKPRLRTIRLDGSSVTYRLNRGDIQAIREVWFEEAYRVPFGPLPRTVLDLGANIGLTSLWLAGRYGCERIVGVEPDPSNVALARRNLEDNGVRGVIVEAATGPVDGTAWFAPEPSSVAGAVVLQAAAGAFEIDVLTPQSVLRRVGLASVDLCKLDIEGAEGPLLLTGDSSWLDAVRSILAELHEGAVDVAAVTAAIEAGGLNHYPGCKTEFFARVGNLVDGQARRTDEA